MRMIEIGKDKYVNVDEIDYIYDECAKAYQ